MRCPDEADSVYLYLSVVQPRLFLPSISDDTAMVSDCNGVSILNELRCWYGKYEILSSG
jgi:hypothetical protein